MILINQNQSFLSHSKWLNELLCNTNNSTLVICLHTVKWLNVTIYPHDRSTLSQLLKPWPSDRLVIFLISGWGHFTLLYIRHNIHNISHCFTQDTTYITESWRKKKKQTRTWVSPKRKKGEVFGIFLAVCASVSVASM